MRPVEETGCGLASPPVQDPTSRSSGDARLNAGRRLEVRPVEETGCGLASPPVQDPTSRSSGDARLNTGRRVEVRPVEETGCGLPSPPMQDPTSRSSGDAQLGAGRELEIPPEENPGGGLAPGSTSKDPKRASDHHSSATMSSATSSSQPRSSRAETGDQINQVDGTIIPRPTQLMVAGNGKRYHKNRNCTGVKMSPHVRDVHVCQICLEKYNPWTSGGTILYAKGINQVMHTSRRHYDLVHPNHDPRIFEPCQVCLPYEM